ncbi:MAG TPA: hypothetical protein VFK30_04590 [Anaerolineae bacterium]|nr:hypothetical protein [Anaerolineae bacterium]
MPGGSRVLHTGHFMLAAEGSGVPQSLQKRDPSRLAVPQLGQ